MKTKRIQLSWFTSTFTLQMNIILQGIEAAVWLTAKNSVSMTSNQDPSKVRVRIQGSNFAAPFRSDDIFYYNDANSLLNTLWKVFMNLF